MGFSMTRKQKNTEVKPKTSAKKKTPKKVVEAKTPNKTAATKVSKVSKVPKRVPKKVAKKTKASSAITVKKPTSTKTSGNYVTKKELLAAVLESKKQGRMTDDLARKLQLVAARFAKSSQFARYTYNEDLQAYAMMMLVRTWNSFNPAKSDNPFAFFTQCIKNSFRQYLNREKQQRNIRDELLIKQGLTPSYNYQIEYESGLADLREEAAYHTDMVDDYNDIDDDQV